MQGQLDAKLAEEIRGVVILAVRDRRDRVNRAVADAMAPARDSAPAQPSAPAAESSPAAAPKRPTVLFDAEETPVRPLTAMERRTAALAGAHGSSSETTGTRP